MRDPLPRSWGPHTRPSPAQRAFPEPRAPRIPIQAPRSTGQHFLMTQGHLGIFISVLGKMWLHSPFTPGSLSLPLRLRPVTCVLSPGCLLASMEAMMCGGWDCRSWVQILGPCRILHPSLGPSKDQFVHLQSREDTRTCLEAGQGDGLSPRPAARGTSSPQDRRDTFTFGPFLLTPPGFRPSTEQPVSPQGHCCSSRRAPRGRGSLWEPRVLDHGQRGRI